MGTTIVTREEIRKYLSESFERISQPQFGLRVKIDIRRCTRCAQVIHDVTTGPRSFIADWIHLSGVQVYFQTHTCEGPKAPLVDGPLEAPA
jgi:hypothetical protein